MDFEEQGSQLVSYELSDIFSPRDIFNFSRAYVIDKD